MRNLGKKLFLFMIVMSLVSFIRPSGVYAVLQSNGSGAATKNIDGWVLGVRQMQSAGGTLGLSDEISTSDLSSSNTNLDIHMEKNTEYGALILLSASAYGKPDKVNDGETTTGNATGVIMKINQEWVAAGSGLTVTTYCKNAKIRYMNNDASQHAGDAINVGSWHGSGATQWYGNYRYSGLVRAYSGSIFSYYADWDYDHGFMPDSAAKYNQSHPSRACIVVGSGI